MPLGQFGPRLGGKLFFSVGGNDAAAVLEGGNGPKYNPSHQSGFADAVAGGASNTNGRLDSRGKVSALGEFVVDEGQDSDLPRLGPGLIGEFALDFAPRKGVKDEAQ